jgi:hypothetical protein
MGGDGKEIWYVFYTTLIIFLKSNIGYIWPTSKKIDPIISLKKKLLELCVKSCTIIISWWKISIPLVKLYY